MVSKVRERQTLVLLHISSLPTVAVPEKNLSSFSITACLAISYIPASRACA